MVSVVLGRARRALREAMRSLHMRRRLSLEQRAVQLVAQATSADTSLRIPDADGYLGFDFDSRPGDGVALAGLHDLACGWMTEPERLTGKMPKNMLRAADLAEHPDILRLSLRDDVLAAVTEYLGQVPRLYTLRLWWSPPNQTQRGSQRFHYDHRDSRQVKLFVNLCDVTEENGPLHFFSATDSELINERVGYSQGRYEDEDVFRAVPRERLRPAVGPRGQAFMLDTGRCLHFGSRGNVRDRLILMANFARVNSVDPGHGCHVLDPVRERLAAELFPGDAVRGFVLTSPR